MNVFPRMQVFVPRSLARRQLSTLGRVVSPADDAGGRTAVSSFPVRREIARHARAFLEGVLQEWTVQPALVDDALLATSELVTNVVQHSASPSVDVEVHLAATGWLTVAVSEHGRSALPPAQVGAVVVPPPTSERGRGLVIVDAVSDQWGITRTRRRTATWFTLAPDPAPRQVLPVADEGAGSL